MGGWLKTLADRLLRLPELRGFAEGDFDSLDAAVRQQAIYRRKKGVRLIYGEYCRPFIESARRAGPGARMVELGSGTSPLKEHLPTLLTSDLLPFPWLDMVCSAHALPFADASLDRIFMMFVAHHIGDMERVLEECRRCLKPGGEFVLIDPAITRFSRFYYRSLHVDPMDLESPEWGFSNRGRLSGANVALPWIVFFRDRELFLRRFPELTIETVEYSTILSFLLSGGLRLRPLLPHWLLGPLFRLENRWIRRGGREWAVTMCLTIRKSGSAR